MTTPGPRDNDDINHPGDQPSADDSGQPRPGAPADVPPGVADPSHDPGAGPGTTPPAADQTATPDPEAPPSASGRRQADSARATSLVLAAIFITIFFAIAAAVILVNMFVG